MHQWEDEPASPRRQELVLDQDFCHTEPRTGRAARPCSACRIKCRRAHVRNVPDLVRKLRILPPVTLTGKRLAFIGGGTMAEAMVRGLLDRHLVPPSHVLVTGPRRERRAELIKTYGVKALASNVEAATDAHVVVLSVKPQVLATVMRELRGKLDEDKLVISIVAGATLRSLRDGLDHADRKSTRLNSSHQIISYAVFCLKKKKKYKYETSGTTKTKRFRIITRSTKTRTTNSGSPNGSSLRLPLTMSQTSTSNCLTSLLRP